MDQARIVIERTIEHAAQTHNARELADIRDRLSRLESQVRLLARAIRRRDLELQKLAGRTRPQVLRGGK